MTDSAAASTPHDRPLRIVYMGTPDFAVPALRALIERSPHEVVGVVTNPDRPSGRGKKMRASPVKRAAIEAGIEVFQPRRFRGDPDAVARLAEFEADLIVVAAYGQILPKEVLELPPHGCLNIHASLLPRYRGAAPINWCLVRGEETSGVTIMQMEEGLDTGPMILKESVEIPELMTAQQLHDALATLGAEMIVEAVDGWVSGALEAVPQDDDAATWAPMIDKSDGLVDWTKSAREVADLIRGFNPWPGTFTYHHPADEGADIQRIKLHLAEPVEDAAGAPGEILVADASEGQLVIACGAGAIACLEIQAPGRRAMEARDFLNGYEIAPGDLFRASKTQE